MANKIIGYRFYKGWYTLHTTTALSNGVGVAVESFNVKEDKISGGQVALDSEIDVLYGRGFDNKAYIKQINIIRKGDK